MFLTISPLKTVFVQRLTTDLTNQSCKQHQRNLVSAGPSVSLSVIESISEAHPAFFLDEGKPWNFNQHCYVFEAFEYSSETFTSQGLINFEATGKTERGLGCQRSHSHRARPQLGSLLS